LATTRVRTLPLSFRKDSTSCRYWRPPVLVIRVYIMWRRNHVYGQTINSITPIACDDTVCKNREADHAKPLKSNDQISTVCSKLPLNCRSWGCQSSAMQVINLVESINCQAASERARSRPPQSRREICPGVPLEGRISRMRSSGSCVQRRSVLSGSIVRRLCENYRELLQMPKIARFRRALVELNHQISNTRKRAARIHEESRVFTQPLRITDLWTLHGEGPL
jgi:hypothetical protein